ncbi:Methionine import ATP-binding protein MetN [compost metagenome]
MHVIQSICDRVAVIHGGGIVEQGKVTEVFLKPQHEVTRDFIRSETQNEGPLRVALDAAAGDNSQAVKITFFGEKTYGSALSDVVRDTGVSFAILHGTISTIKDVPYGQMIVRFEGPAEAIAVTISRLIAQGLDVEVIS